jgi:REP element-mobilizing transposase RayT
MRPLRELSDGVWYEIHTAINRQDALFQSRQTIALFAQVLGEVSQRFVFEIRGLRLKDERIGFYIKPKDGFKLPQIMQWLKQTFCVRYNFLHGLKGHTWGDRYWSEILDGEPPPKAEPWTGPVMGVEAAEFSPDKAREEACSGGAADKDRPRFMKTEGGVCPISGKPAETPRKSAAPPG